MKAKPIPVGYEGATPYLYCRKATAALAFYKKAFGARERMRMEMPGGKIGHAEIKIGGAHIMLADEFPDMGVLGPQSIGGSPVTVLIYVKDVDARSRRAQKSLVRSATSFTVTAIANCATRSAIRGCSPPAKKISRPSSSLNAPPPCLAASDSVYSSVPVVERIR